MPRRQPRRRCSQKTAPTALEHLEDRYLLSVDGFAPIDGVGNNVDNPELGSTNEQLIRIGDAAYDDGLNEPARSDGVNAREISDLLSAQEESIENDRFVTSVWFLWGQFLDHDITRVFDSAPESTSEITSLDISEQFPFNRSPYDLETGIDTPREQVNHVTAFIDGSVVYGSDNERALALRTLQGGLLKSQDTDVGELLPFNVDGLSNDPAPIPNFFVAGDVRSNENAALTAMQTLWVREHNRVAKELAETEFVGQDLTDPAVDEAIYQRARQYVSALIQNITYNEFLPSTLGFNAIDTYSGYDPTIDPQISNEFTTSAFRIGHTTLPEELLLGGDGDSISLVDAFFNPQLVLDQGIEGLLEGVTLQQMQEVDSLIVDAVRNFLMDGPGFDLAAINIQRGRDHGLPDYNTAREAVGLERIDSFSEMTSNAELAAIFEQIYGTPDNADPWIAMISEDRVPGTMVGETMYRYLVDQFTRLRDGDRFYFENALSDDLAGEIKATRLSDVIERNTGLDVQDEVFWTHDTLVFRNGLDNEWLIRDFGDNGGAEVVFFGEPGIRDPDNRTETAPVQRDEPINAVIVAGINELGDGFFIPNALVSSPLADAGIDEFIITADIDFFEGYGLGGNDRWVFESDIAFAFASGDAGRDELVSTSDLKGAKIAFTGGDGRDTIVINAANAEFAAADGGDGRDTIRVNAAGAETVEVSGGSRNDRIRVAAVGASSIVVDGNGGRDSIRVNGRNAETIEVNGGRGSDVIFVNARGATSAQIHGDHGHDFLRVKVSRDTATDIEGGRGRDRLIVEGQRPPRRHVPSHRPTGPRFGARPQRNSEASLFRQRRPEIKEAAVKRPDLIDQVTLDQVFSQIGRRRRDILTSGGRRR